jgi:hypothetical protein
MDEPAVALDRGPVELCPLAVSRLKVESVTKQRLWLRPLPRRIDAPLPLDDSASLAERTRCRIEQ